MAQEIPTITTTRLTLRAFTEADVEPLFQLLAEPDVLRYFPNPGPPARDRVEKLVTSFATKGQSEGPARTGKSCSSSSSFS